MSQNNINNNNDIIMDLEIPSYVYIIIFIIFIVIFIFKYFFSNEEIFDFIEKNKKELLKTFSKEETQINLLTKLNTKINRDYLDNSHYFYEKGYKKIYEDERTSLKNINKKNDNDNENKKEKIYIKKNKRVGFSNDIIYENSSS